MMTDTPTPTTAEEAAAMAAALNTYHAAKLVEAREFIGSETFASFRAQLESILAEGLPDGAIKTLIQNVVTVVNALTTVNATITDPVTPSETPPVSSEPTPEV